MLRADIRQFSIVRRPVNEDIMRSSPYVAGRHSLDHVNQRHVNREFSIAANGTSGRSRENVCPIDLRVLVM